MAMTPEQVKIYRAMSPARKLEIAAEFQFAARDLKAAVLRTQHPDWPEDKIRAKVREAFLYATS